MKITIYGAGAIGGNLGALLDRNGVDVSLIARGAHLDAMRKNGLKLITDKETFVTHPRVTDNPAELGVQDYIIVSLKSHQAPTVVEAMQPMMGPDTTVVTAMNGIPWWYCHALKGPLEGRRIKAVDPLGTQWDGIGPERVIGCITYVASEVVEPGVIESGGAFRYQIGEPDNSISPRAQALCDVIDQTIISAEVSSDLRRDFWVKLMGNVAYNPSSALTLGTTGEMIDDADMQQVLRNIMAEVKAVGTALGSAPEASIDDRIEGSRKGAHFHKSSMLQDLERGRQMEINPIIGAVAELGKIADVATPTIDTVLALVRLRARSGDLLPDPA